MVDLDPFSNRPRPRGGPTVTGSIERQIGEIVGAQRAVHEDIMELKDGVASIAREQRESAADRRTQQQVLSARLENLERTTAERHQANAQLLSTLKADVAEMKDPIGQFVSMKKRAGAIGMAAIAFAGFTWTLAEPIWNFFVTKLFGGSH
jgi:hypothetical protein